eukprot:jgi/Ulvmu1/10935/UM007_0114.1
MLCAISNAVPAEPVVCTKTGHVFERSLIEKYLEDTGKCPMSGQEMSKDDLMPLKMGKPIKPRHTPAMSIPGILGMLHNEYDSVMLEAYELRDALRKSRKELAESLYSHDAACRVIARLQSEKDAAEKALQDLQAQVVHMRQQATASVSVGPAESATEGPQAKRPRPAEDGGGLSEADIKDMEAARQHLSADRRHRDPNLPGLAAVSDLDSLAQAAAQPLHSPSQPGVLAVALQPSSGPQEEPKLVATGGADHTVQILDVEGSVIAATLAGHTKKVTALAFAGPSVLVSGSADGAVRCWHRGQGDDSSKWTQQFSHTLPDTVVDVCVHPVERFVVALSSAASWAMLDVQAGRVAFAARDAELPGYTCGAMHPDGNFFAACGTEGGVRLFDTRQAVAPLSKMEGVQGAVRSISFNENGYWAAVASDAGVQLWDLRKMSITTTLQPFDAPAATVSWDFSGKFLACGGPGAVKVYEVIYKGKKKGTDAHVAKALLDLPSKAVHVVRFGALAHSLYVGASDHNLRVYRC